MSRFGLTAVLLSAAVSASANTYTVTSTADSGVGTLRQAILDANANPGPDTIAFGIVGTGPHTIAPASALPTITGPVMIDGYSQSGSSANTNPTTLGLNTVLKIEIDCTNAGGTSCLIVKADDVTIKGLAVNRSQKYDIEPGDTVTHHQNLVVEGCFLGPSVDGTQALSPAHGGVTVSNFSNARIGGTTPAARNLIVGGSSGNTVLLASPAVTDSLVAGNLIGTDVTGKVLLSGAAGVNIQYGSNNVIGGASAAARNVIGREVRIGGLGNGLQATGNFVMGNFIGADVTGTVPFECHNACIEVGDEDNVIGGSSAGAGNRVGGSDAVGIRIGLNAAGTVILGNFVGTDETGIVILPIATYGILASQTSGSVTIGGINPGEGNVVSRASLGGIAVQGTATATIRGNSVFDNPGVSVSNGLGIDLLTPSPGVTYNDAADADAGPNGLQNFPILASVTYGGSSTTVAGTLDSAAATVYDVDFYADPVCARRPQDLAEGKTYIGSTQITTDGSGHAAINAVIPVAVPAGSPITATATDPAGNTSEFSPRFALGVSPRSGTSPSAVTVTGLAFEDGATATVGGLPATNVTVVDAHTLTMGIPQFMPAGSVNAVTVQNPGGGLSGTIPNGFIVNFNDVPSSNLFYVQVIKLVASGITAGVGGGLYGVNQDTKRQQMAVFLLKSKYGACYAPPPCVGAFPDVPCPSTFASWIEALAAEGITGGCGGGLFCPGNPVRRDQMAVFLLKTRHGSNYVPPACSGDFGDVACPGNPFANWIEQLAAEGITGGCGGGNYCPLNNVTRGQMAAFLVNTFSLP